MIQIGRVAAGGGRERCDTCPVVLKDSLTEIEFSGHMDKNRVRLCPACLVLLEKLIRVERDRVTQGRAGR